MSWRVSQNENSSSLFSFSVILPMSCRTYQFNKRTGFSSCSSFLQLCLRLARIRNRKLQMLKCYSSSIFYPPPLSPLSYPLTPPPSPSGSSHHIVQEFHSLLNSWKLFLLGKFPVVLDFLSRLIEVWLGWENLESFWLDLVYLINFDLDLHCPLSSSF